MLVNRLAGIGGHRPRHMRHVAAGRCTNLNTAAENSSVNRKGIFCCNTSYAADASPCGKFVGQCPAACRAGGSRREQPDRARRAAAQALGEGAVWCCIRRCAAASWHCIKSALLKLHLQPAKLQTRGTTDFGGSLVRLSSTKRAHAVLLFLGIRARATRRIIVDFKSDTKFGRRSN